MKSLLPPLKPLLTFEAVARHLSFSRAADELHVTQSAVSHQIQSLESYFGKSLLHRKDRPLSVTDEGQKLLLCIEEIMGKLSACTASILGHSGGAVQLGAFMVFALKTLMPKLPDFRRSYPSINLHLEMLSNNQPSETDNDILILSFAQAPTGYDIQLLMQDTFYPVCSPILYETLKKTGDKEELFHNQTLLCLGDAFEWRAWCESTSFNLPDNTQFHRFNDWVLSIQAAIESQGIALGLHSLVKDDIKNGKLKKLPIESKAVPWPYYLCVKKEKRFDPSVQQLKKWLIDLLERKETI